MTREFNLESFRLLPLGDAKAETNDDTGRDAPEDDFVHYDKP